MTDRKYELLTGDSVTASGEVGCIMLMATGLAGNTHFFQYKPGFFSGVITVQWEGDAMQAVLPPEIANYLIKNGYARRMTAAEIQSYNTEVQKETMP